MSPLQPYTVLLYHFLNRVFQNVPLLSPIDVMNRDKLCSDMIIASQYRRPSAPFKHIEDFSSQPVRQSHPAILSSSKGVTCAAVHRYIKPQQ
jgi:hypothetical protein